MMTVAEFLESGLIECYVLGSATPAEMQLVEEMALAHLEVRSLLEQTELTLIAYAETHAVAPRAELRESVLAAVLAANETPVIPIQAQVQTTPVSSNSQFRTWALAASVLLLLSVGGNIWFWTNASKTNERLAALEQEKTSATEQNKTIAEQLAQQQKMVVSLQHDHDMATNPQVSSMLLKGQKEFAQVNFLAHWDKSAKFCCIHNEKLAPLPEGKQYQLWAIVNGKPVDAGVLPIDELVSVHQLPKLETAEAFAVTLEKTGGVSQPEGPMVALASL
ncbi:MAG: anti-sigma factor domain-containing protein [Bacteroidia bacterium]